MKGVKALGILLAVLAAGGSTVPAAAAAPPLKLAPGIYSYARDFQKGPLVVFTVLKGSARIARGAFVNCRSGQSPPRGIPANHTIALRIPTSLRLIDRRRFSYSGAVTAYPVGNFAGVPAHLVIRAGFAGGVRARGGIYPTGFKGSFASSVCSSGSPIRFAFSYL